MLKFYCEEAGRALAELKSTPDGLTDAEAARRLAEKGPNKLAEGKKVTTLQRFLQQLSDPMIIILLVAAAVSGVTAAYSGESFADVFIILIVVLINAVLGVYQESKAEKAIEALQEMTAATSKVIRGGKQVSLKSEELVPGDVVVLEAGDAVPADGRILESASLKIEEAALTGESVPVNKVVSALGLDDGKDVPLGDRKNMAYMGSTVVYGRGRVLITGTGMDTEMGKIAGALAQAEEGQTPLQKKLAQLSKILSWLVLGICVFIFAFSLIKAGDFHLDVIISTFMVAVSLAVAAIPEGLATVVTIVLSIGVTNMSKRNAVIRRLTAVETLGCAQVICSDKTGTLTQNKMTVVEHVGEEEPLARAMSLCSDAKPGENGDAEGEPTECALVNYATGVGLPKGTLEAAQPRVGEAPFDSGRKMMSTVHENNGAYIQYTKGAPDVVLSRCTSYAKDGKILPMTEEARAEILRAVADGRRIHVRDVSVVRRGHGHEVLGLRQARHVVANARVAALRRDHFLQLFKPRAALQRPLHAHLAVFHIPGDPRRDEHPAAQLQRHGQQVAARASGEDVDGLLDLQRVAHVRAQRLLHARHQREDRLARLRADIDHGLRQRDGILQRVHQRAAAGLHIQHNCARAARQLLGYDARGDQRDAVHRAGHVAQRVKRLIRRAEVVRLADDRAADFLHLPHKARLRLLHRAAGDALQLIQRAARVPEAAAGNLRDLRAAGRRQRHEHQRRRIAHAAGGMFIHANAVDGGQINHAAGMHHFHRQAGRLLRVHAPPANRHQQRRKLVIRDGSRRRALREKANFLRAERFSRFLFENDIHHVHIRSSFGSVD